MQKETDLGVAEWHLCRTRAGGHTYAGETKEWTVVGRISDKQMTLRDQRRAVALIFPITLCSRPISSLFYVPPFTKTSTETM